MFPVRNTRDTLEETVFVINKWRLNGSVVGIVGGGGNNHLSNETMFLLLLC
jgi:hypothetical protein